MMKESGVKESRRGNGSNDKMKEEKIILNYLCCLFYDACGIRRGSSMFKNTVKNILRSRHTNVYKVLESIR